MTDNLPKALERFSLENGEIKAFLQLDGKQKHLNPRLELSRHSGKI